MADDRCPHCGHAVQPTEQTCPQCKKGLSGRALIEPRPKAADVKSVEVSGAAKFFYVVAMLGSLVGTYELFNGLQLATSAPQQAAAAAIACCYAVVPYVLARAVEKITR